MSMKDPMNELERAYVGAARGPEGRPEFILAMKQKLLPLFLAAAALVPALAVAREDSTRDLSFFLRRLRTLDHLPVLESSHTAMSSTWDRGGAVADGKDFKRIEGNHNILLDAEGPGCVHRIFVGLLGKDVAGTRIQIFLDHNPTPTFDLTVDEFFDDKSGPIPYPLVFHKTYPGTLFPILFARHCRIQLVNPEAKNWGQYWQVTHTTFPRGTKVRSLTWPLNEAERAELKKVCDSWLRAESAPPDAPPAWAVAKTVPLEPAQSESVTLSGRGVVRQMRVALKPATAETVRDVRLKMYWDGNREPSVDVPLAYFFGLVDPARSRDSQFNSLLLGVGGEEAYCCFPMPFARGAKIVFENNSGRRLDGLSVRLEVQPLKKLPADWGRFHATWRMKRAAAPDSPCYGAQSLPAHLVLERAGAGKYVGTLLHVNWPSTLWWGEGDWLFWTDEDGWPPSYHGTGTEEYFNSGWCNFDRKAVSGYITRITTQPGEAAVYSFHLNDAFQFRKRVRVAVETVGFEQEMQIINEQHPYWGSTAFWYAAQATAANSTKTANTSPAE